MVPEFYSKASSRMARKAPLCRSCGMPMKGHSKSGCLIPKHLPSPDDGISTILSTPSFVIPETGPFRRQNPNYVLLSPKAEPAVLSSASFTPTELVPSENAKQRSFPPFQQFTPNWSRPSSPQPTRRVPKQQQSSFVVDSAPAPLSLFTTQPENSVRLVAAIYQVPNTATESFLTRAVSNGIYCVPVEPPRELISEDHTQNVDWKPSSTWIVTGRMTGTVNSLVAILRPRGLGSTSVIQMVRSMNALHYGVLAVLLLCVFKFIKW